MARPFSSSQARSALRGGSQAPRRSTTTPPPASRAPPRRSSATVSPTYEPPDLFEDVRTPAAVNIISRRGAGKTQLARSLVYALGLRGELTGGVVVFSETAGFSGDWDGIGQGFPFSEEALQHYVDAQRRRVAAAQAKGRDPPHLVVVFDDCADQQFHNSKAVKWLYTKGRHIHVTVISIVQLPTMLAPAARNNADNVFIGGQAGDGLQAIFEMISFPGQFKEFQKLAWDRTKDHAFLCYSAASGRLTPRRATPVDFAVN